MLMGQMIRGESSSSHHEDASGEFEAPEIQVCYNDILRRTA